MLLALDIGNSSINSGIFVKKELVSKLKMPSNPKKESDYYRNKIRVFLSKNNIEIPLTGVIISSVVPGLTAVLNESVKGLSRGLPIVVSASLKTGLRFDVESPGELGSDRISNAVAARELFGSPVIVVDFGTATTISVVKGRRFVGGAILPGLRLMSDALGRGTARLPSIDMAGIAGTPIPALGKNTAMCIMSGILYGMAGAAERIIDEIEKAENCRFRTVITGGYCDTMTRFVRRKHYSDPDLTLKGLRLIYERNA